ncbi:MAG: heme lyase CcmF/NrfE family subunit [Anaerolineae bacterium]|nr:heme lyase CcmF/NrfE family subunit [Gemmatimonadaceae bacterium]
MILVGELALWVALLMAAWGTTVSFAGGATGRGTLIASGERASYATLAFVVLASLGLWSALFASDFSIKYVASFTSSNLPKAYKFTAFWAGQSGSLLFWTLILSLYAALATFTNRRRNREMMPFVTGTLSAVTLFFLLVTCLGSNPYERLDWLPPDGRGMNPQLQNPGMAIHPPTLYLGYVATAIPFAFAVAALLARRLNAEWLAAVRRWALLSWFFLTIGVVLGMWWAYVELGWGGYWAWDPVENSSFLPWLTTTAFLHSIMIQEKRGMLRKWNVTLVISTFLLSILGTFITRSGVISSVHSFAQSPIGYWFAGFLVLATAISAYLVSTRLSDLKAQAHLESMVSREASFLFNNLLLVGIAFSILWGTLFPILSEAVRGTKITVGPPFFNQVNIPLGLLLLALTGVGPLIAWRRASPANLKRQFTGPVVAGVAVGVLLFALGMRDVYALISYTLAGFVMTTIVQEFLKGVGARRRMYGENAAVALLRLIGRNRRRYGGYVVHVGIVVLFAAFAGLAFKKEFDITLAPGERFVATDPYGDEWTFVSNGISRFEQLNRHVTAVALQTSRNGRSMPLITSEKRQHVDSRGAPTFEPSTEVGILESLRQDVYVVLAGVSSNENAEIRVTFNPLVWWVWFGGVIMAIGGLIVMWPQAELRRAQGGYLASLKPEPEVVAGR